MCLITKQKRVKRAKEDIVCYKIVQRCTSSKKQAVRADNFYFEYTLGKLYSTEMVADNIPNSYADNIVESHYKLLTGFTRIASKLTNVHEGFHSAVSIERFKIAGYNIHNYNRIYVKCIIPKRSLYYEDATGLLCSNQIIIQEEIKEDIVVSPKWAAIPLGCKSLEAIILNSN